MSELLELHNTTPGVKSYLYNNLFIDVFSAGKITFGYSIRRRAEGKIIACGSGKSFNLALDYALTECHNLNPTK
jgi:hypothetical protein